MGLMNMENPELLAAELRVRALCASPDERADLCFLATEYERLASSRRQEIVKVMLPK